MTLLLRIQNWQLVERWDPDGNFLSGSKSTVAGTDVKEGCEHLVVK